MMNYSCIQPTCLIQEACGLKSFKSRPQDKGLEFDIHNRFYGVYSFVWTLLSRETDMKMLCS